MLPNIDESHPINETYNFNTAGWNAAPTAKELIEEISYTHIPPQYPRRHTTAPYPQGFTCRRCIRGIKRVEDTS